MLEMNKISKRVYFKGIIFLALFNFICCSHSFGQDFKMVKPYTWMIGIHWNVIDDNGDRFSGLVDPANAWNYLPYPSAINIDYYFREGFSAEFMGSYNYYDSTKVINGEKNRPGHVLTLDLNAKYTFGYLMEQQWFDPFAVLGVGYTGREALWPQNMLSVNAGAGFNVMIFAGLGIQVRSTVKVGVMPQFNNVEGDYLQHHAGLIYKFPEKGAVNNFGKPKHKWTRKRVRYRGSGGR